MNNNKEKNDENIDNIKEVRVYKWKAPPQKKISSRSNLMKSSQYAEDSFANAGTGESILDSLPNDVLQDVLLKYWHNNHEYNYSQQEQQEEVEPTVVGAILEKEEEQYEYAAYDENDTTTYEGKYDDSYYNNTTYDDNNNNNGEGTSSYSRRRRGRNLRPEEIENS